ncbi:hypothetical protein NX059_000301 [Plenodomus lindquistii]|nr:hypothetical protein NX059_000301 [Plenodomus lindquistii]
MTYGDLEPVDLPSDDSKRAADAEPDFEEFKVDSPVESPISKSPDVPLLVVERTDDQPVHGDDFGKHATSAQRLAHEQRAADASPDRLIISPESSEPPPPGNDETAPLFPHESVHINEPSKTPSIGTIDEESIQSSADQTSSGDAVCTPLEDSDESQDDGELGNAPLLSHETGAASRSSELQATPLFSHEDGSNQEDSRRVEQAPLLSHKSDNDDNDRSLSDEDELDQAPLLSHETNFPNYRNGSIITNSEYDHDDDEDVEPKHYGPYDEDDEPLLPHERDSAVVSKTDSEDDEHLTLDNEPTFGYENDASQPLFGGNTRPNYFRTRTNSSTLPHKLPRTDEDDDNLHDPSLEQFPTNREQILERVKSIGLHLPEDESTDYHTHSPQSSVLSQACSSVELAPVKSHLSLASVPEADYSDEDDQDVESLASPIMIGGASTRPFDEAADGLKTPAADESKRLQVPESEPGATDVKTAMPAETENEDENISAESGSGVADTLQNSLLSVLPSKVAGAVTSSDPSGTTTTSNETTHNSTLRERRKAHETDSESNHRTKDVQFDADDEHTGTVTSQPAAQQLVQRHSSFIQDLMSSIDAVSRFITACTQDRKRASITAIALGSAVAAAYFVVFGS